MGSITASAIHKDTERGGTCERVVDGDVSNWRFAAVSAPNTPHAALNPAAMEGRAREVGARYALGPASPRTQQIDMGEVCLDTDVSVDFKLIRDVGTPDSTSFAMCAEAWPVRPTVITTACPSLLAGNGVMRPFLT